MVGDEMNNRCVLLSLADGTPMVTVRGDAKNTLTHPKGVAMDAATSILYVAAFAESKARAYHIGAQGEEPQLLFSSDSKGEG